MLVYTAAVEMRKPHEDFRHYHDLLLLFILATAGSTPDKPFGPGELAYLPKNEAGRFSIKALTASAASCVLIQMFCVLASSAKV